MTTPVPASGAPAVAVALGSLLTGVTVTVTARALVWPLSPSRPKVSRLSRPPMPWRWNPLSASLTVTVKESVTPVCAEAASGV